MSRRRRTILREINPEPRYNSVTLAKYINTLMLNGKKSVAERIVYQALQRASDKLKREPLEVFGEVMERLRPTVEVRSRRVGGATYPVPVEVREARSTALAMRWLIQAARKRNEKNMSLRLYGEFLDVLDNRGQAMKKREDIYRMAESNRAFSHFRF